MRRRDFLKLLATSTTGAVLFTGCRLAGYEDSEFQIQSPVEHPVDLREGRDNWYATALPAVSGGLGVVVRVFEGRAKKVSGNPDFPLNYEKIGPRADAMLQELYHPDRIDGPKQLSGSRGSGNYNNVNWDDAVSDFQGLLDQAENAVLVTQPLSGAMARIVTEFAEANDVRHVIYEPDERVVLREVMQRVFGTSQLPALDIANANTIVSFSADFLHNWISPVQFSRGYGEFRQGEERDRGQFYFVGPRLSDTAASADRWYPIMPGSEGLVALAVANVMVAEGMADADTAAEVYSGISLDDYSPDVVAEAAGISADQIRELATALGQNTPSIAIAGSSAAAHTNGSFNLGAVFALNYLTGSVNTEGGLILNPENDLSDDLPSYGGGLPYSEWAALADEMRNGDVDLLMVHRADPVYGLPPASGFEEALDGVSNIVSFSSFVDDTTAHADLVLPDHVVLEQWGIEMIDPAPGYQLIALQQPVVQPFVNTRSLGDVLIQAGGLNYESYEDAVRQSALSLQGLNRGNIDSDDEREFFMIMQTQGGWWDEESSQDDAPGSPDDMPEPADPEFSGDLDEYPFHLLPFPTNSFDYGQFAHLPWLQALPDPVTTAVWTSWVELNPETAEQLDMGTGDIARLESPQGTIEVPVYVNPAAPPNVAAVPMGQGHQHYSHYAEERGANPMSIVAPQLDAATGALAWAATRIRIESAERRERFPRFEGQLPFQLDDNPVIQITRG